MNFYADLCSFQYFILSVIVVSVFEYVCECWSHVYECVNAGFTNYI